MTSPDEVLRLYNERRKARSAVVNKAEEIRRAYNGEYVLPLPELNRNERAAVANLLQLGIDQTGMRIASNAPSLFCPPDRPGIKRSEDEAAIRRKALYGWWEASGMAVKRGRRARHLIAYTASPVIIRPDYKRGVPVWQVRDPLSTYPAPCADLDDMEPENCIFAFTRSLSWLQARYPEQATMVYKGQANRPDDLFDILEYVDADEHVMVVAGRAKDPYGSVGDLIYGVSRVETLERFPNRAGLCPVVMPGRVTLDRPLGQFDGALGVYVKQARLAALEEIAIERGVFPEQWFVAEGNGAGRIITQADGRLGIIGEVAGGKIETVQLSPGYKTDAAIDRNERYIRVEGRIPAEYSGESASNVRTDRRGNSILSATVDHTIAESQRVLAASGQAENVRAIAIAKGYFGSQRKTFWVQTKGATGQVDYVPDRDFGSDANFVRYALPGSDVNGLATSIGQRMGLGTMSDRTAMELDPLIDDPDLEKERVLYQALERAQLGALAQAAQQGSLPPADMAAVALEVLQGKLNVFEATVKIHELMQQRQATSGEPGTPQGPVDPNSPEAQAGMAAGTAGAPAAAAGTAPPGPNTHDLGQLLRSLHSAGSTPQATPVPVG